jgi:hypothetical protein
MLRYYHDDKILLLDASGFIRVLVYKEGGKLWVLEIGFISCYGIYGANVVAIVKFLTAFPAKALGEKSQIEYMEIT